MTIDFHQEDQIIKASNTYPVEDEIFKRVEKPEDNIIKQKDKNRILEYLIMVSAEMTNQMTAKPHRQCSSSDLQGPQMTVIQSAEDNIIIPDMGPGLPRLKYRNVHGSPGSKSTTSSNKLNSSKIVNRQSNLKYR